MENEKRLLIVVILSLAVLFFWPYLMEKYFPPPPPDVGAPQALEQTAEALPAVVEETVPVRDRFEEPVFAEPVFQEVEEEFVTIDTPLYKAVLTTLGGGVKSLELKNYKKTLGGIEGVDIAATIDRDNPLKTLITAAGLPAAIPFERPSRDKISLSEGDTAEVEFSWTSPDGIKIDKKLSLSADGYGFGVELKVTNGSAGASSRNLTGEVLTRLVASYLSEEAPYFHHGPLWYEGDEAERQDVDDGLKSGRAGVDWLGLEDKYFLFALIPGNGLDNGPGNGPDKDTDFKWDTEVLSIDTSRLTLTEELHLGPGETKTYAYNAYLGPKHYDTLLSYRVGLEEAIEFGFFSFLAKPFLVVLNFFERFFKNYGLAIIFLTCIIKVVFHPLTKHSLRSMREMQKIQPQLKLIKEKYKDNKEKLNKEMMELYKRYKINPLGGCLPMLLQIPVFIALYEVLNVAIELRHAPFMLWIVDLSSKDPLYITPVLMGASMFLQQKMSPTAMDPAQAKMMLMLPIVFTFLFLSFPSGLVLYWLVNNVLSIAQQYHINKDKK